MSDQKPIDVLRRAAAGAQERLRDAREWDRDLARRVLRDGGAQPEFLPTFVDAIADVIVAAREEGYRAAVEESRQRLHRCPDCRCADDARPPQPSTSSEWARRQAREAAEAAVRAAKEKRGVR